MRRATLNECLDENTTTDVPDRLTAVPPTRPSREPSWATGVTCQPVPAAPAADPTTQATPKNAAEAQAARRIPAKSNPLGAGSGVAFLDDQVTRLPPDD